MKVIDHEDGWLIDCPACRCSHLFISGRWQFNGDYELPSFTPSMLIKIGPMPLVPIGRPDAGKIHVCHSVVTGGLINYCSDSTHSMSGQTVRLEDI